LTGLLLPGVGATTLIAGDAIPTAEHLSAGQVFTPCFDLEAARESFQEAIEIADWVVCGRDNIVPSRRELPGSDRDRRLGGLRSGQHRAQPGLSARRCCGSLWRG
jgi:hypothetical protein